MLKGPFTDLMILLLPIMALALEQEGLGFWERTEKLCQHWTVFRMI